MKRGHRNIMVVIFLVFLLVVLGYFGFVACKNSKRSDAFYLPAEEKNWGKIHPDFEVNPDLVEGWKRFNCNYEGVKKVINEGWFMPNEAFFFQWILSKKNRVFYELNSMEMENFRKEFKDSKGDFLRDLIAGCFHTWMLISEKPKEEKAEIELMRKFLRNKDKTDKECYQNIKKILAKFPSYKNDKILTSHLDCYLKELRIFLGLNY
jgi:hypothetical protein